MSMTVADQLKELARGVDDQATLIREAARALESADEKHWEALLQVALARRAAEKVDEHLAEIFDAIAGEINEAGG